MSLQNVLRNVNSALYIVRVAATINTRGVSYFALFRPIVQQFWKLFFKPTTRAEEELHSSGGRPLPLLCCSGVSRRVASSDDRALPLLCCSVVSEATELTCQTNATRRDSTQMAAGNTVTLSLPLSFHLSLRTSVRARARATKNASARSVAHVQCDLYAVRTNAGRAFLAYTPRTYCT